MPATSLEHDDTPWWATPGWWAAGRNTAVSRNGLVSAWRVRVGEDAREAGGKAVEAKLCEQELKGWLALLGQTHWVADAYGGEVARRARTAPAAANDDPPLWTGVSHLIGEYAWPLAQLTAALVNPEDVQRPKDLPAEVGGPLRDIFRHYIAADARRELVGDPSTGRGTVTARQPKGVLATAQAAADFLDNPDVALAATRVAARQRLVRRVNNLMVDYAEDPAAKDKEEVCAELAEFRDTLVDQYGAPASLRSAATAQQQALVRGMIEEFLAAEPSFATGVTRPVAVPPEPAEDDDSQEWGADNAQPVVPLTQDGDRADLIGEVVARAHRWMLGQVVVGFTPDAAVTMRMMLDFEVKDWRRKRAQDPVRAAKLRNKLRVELPPVDGRRTVEHDRIGAGVAGRDLVARITAVVETEFARGVPGPGRSRALTTGCWEHLTARHVLAAGPQLLAGGFESLEALILLAWDASARAAGARRPAGAVCRTKKDATAVITSVLRVAAVVALGDADTQSAAAPEHAPGGRGRWDNHQHDAQALLDELRGDPDAI